jgi:hypothetical protein
MIETDFVGERDPFKRSFGGLLCQSVGTWRPESGGERARLAHSDRVGRARQADVGSVRCSTRPATSASPSTDKRGLPRSL